MKVLRITVLSVAMLGLAGCGSMGLENKRVDYKSQAVRVPSLEVPPDLTVPAEEDHYSIPGGASVAKYSDYAKGGTASMPGSSSVLPEFRKVRLEQSGTQRWLLVEDKAENIWPVVKSFLQQNGLSIATEDPQAGVIETGWAENRSNIPRNGLRSILGKVFDGMYDSGTRDMYRVRLERSGNNTEIYLTQYGKEEVLSEDKSTSRWESRPEDRELEAVMLQKLMVKLGGAEVQGRTGNAAVAQGASVAPVLQARDDGSEVIVLSEPFDKSWRIVGLALDEAGFAVEDKDRDGGVYFLSVEETRKKSWLDKLAFWRGDEDAKSSTRYKVIVRETGSGCEVAASGANNTGARRIIDGLFKVLSK